MRNNILITSAGRTVSLVRAFQQELKNIFPDAKVITIGSQPKLSATCIVSDKVIIICKINHSNYLDELFAISN